MAENRLQIELSAPSHPPVVFEADEVSIPGTAGVFTVLPGHTPLLTTLNSGVIATFEGDSPSRAFAVHQGFAEVLANRITILANTLELAESIDSSRAEAAAERARERLRLREEETDIVRAEASLARSLARLQAQSGRTF